MSYLTYILYFPSKDRDYIGHTQDPLKRLTEHNGGYEKSTAPYVPWILIGFLEKQSKSEAYAIEIHPNLKKQPIFYTI